MPGPDQQMIGQRPELVQGGEHASGHLLAAARLGRDKIQQVGTAHIAHKDEIAGEDHAGSIAGGRVDNQKAEMLGSVTGRVQNLDADVAHHETIPLLQALMRKSVLPGSIARIGKQQSGSHRLSQRPGAAEKISVDVRFGDMRDAQSRFLGQPDILTDIAQRVDNQRLACNLATDDITILSQLGLVKLSEKHAASFSPDGRTDKRSKHTIKSQKEESASPGI